MCKILINIMKSEMFLTIISGVFVFIISQLIMEIIIKPREKFKEVKGKIFCILAMYANLIFNPCKIDDMSNRGDYSEASKEIRKIASEFSGMLESHPIVCKKKKYYDVVNNLIGISNGLFQISPEYNTIKENRKCVNYIYKKFNVKERF